MLSKFTYIFNISIPKLLINSFFSIILYNKINLSLSLCFKIGIRVSLISIYLFVIFKITPINILSFVNLSSKHIKSPVL